MARTACQKQTDKRTKDALQLRARFDARLRKAAGQLLDALTGTAQTKARLDRINLLYGVDISTETPLVHDVRVAGLGETLGPLLAQSAPGEEVQFFNPTQDGNGGLLLATESVFGEAIETPPIIVFPGPPQMTDIL